MDSYQVDGLEHCNGGDLVKIGKAIDALDPSDVSIAAPTADDGSFIVPQLSEDGILLHNRVSLQLQLPCRGDAYTRRTSEAIPTSPRMETLPQRQ
jgi:hypothetical protein